MGWERPRVRPGPSRSPSSALPVFTRARLSSTGASRWLALAVLASWGTSAWSMTPRPRPGRGPALALYASHVVFFYPFLDASRRGCRVMDGCLGGVGGCCSCGYRIHLPSRKGMPAFCMPSPLSAACPYGIPCPSRVNFLASLAYSGPGTPPPRGADVQEEGDRTTGSMNVCQGTTCQGP